MTNLPQLEELANSNVEFNPYLKGTLNITVVEPENPRGLVIIGPGEGKNEHLLFSISDGKKKNVEGVENVTGYVVKDAQVCFSEKYLQVRLQTNPLEKRFGYRESSEERGLFRIYNLLEGYQKDSHMARVNVETHKIPMKTFLKIVEKE